MDKLFDFLNNLFEVVEKETKISFEEHKKNVSLKLIDPEIGFDIDGPMARGKKIFLSPNHMRYLWCVCYFMVFIFEQYISKNWNVEHYTVDFENDIPAKRALELLEWGKSQLEEDQEFPNRLPSPDVKIGNDYLTQVETDYALKTNTIWIKAMAFVFLHEYFHIVLGHTKLSGLSNAEKIEKEWEAEKSALEFIKLPEHFQEDDFIGLLSFMLSNFFDLVDVRNIKPEKHLPLNERLDKVLQHFEFNSQADSRYVQYFYHFASVGLLYGLTPLGIDFNHLGGTYNDARDYFNRLYNAIMEKVNVRNIN
jgi:hypothetical protein